MSKADDLLGEIIDTEFGDGGGVYRASRIKRRRATRAEMERRKDAMLALCDELHPATVRQVFYVATVRGYVEKSERGYDQVQRALVDLRRDGALPYGYIVDGTRWMRKPNSFRTMADAARFTAETYRRALWADADAYCEVWIEKDALAGAVFPVTSEFDVPLMVARGYASLSFLHQAAMAMAAQDRPCFVYHLGDHDPSGVDAGRKIERTLHEMAPRADIRFERIAVNPDQIAFFNLPSRPTKRSDTRARYWSGDSVELDALQPAILRAMVRRCLEKHLPADRLKVLKVAEASERQGLLLFADQIAESRR